MTTTAWVIAALTLAVATLDWWAVATARRRVEWIAKPLVLVGVLAITVVLRDVDRGVWAWFVVAFVFGLLGDVFLLGPERLFPAGLGSFLIGHLAAIVGLLVAGVDAAWFVVGLVVATLVCGLVGRRVVAGAARHSLGVPVVAYLGALGTMGALAVGTGHALAGAAGLLFVASDGLLGWDKFVARVRWSRPAVHVTYHAAQLGFALWVATT